MTMTESQFYPKKIYIEKQSLSFPLTKKILKKARQVPVEVIKNSSELIERLNASRDPVSEGKELLLLTRQSGEFVKPCPCTPHHIGCNYFIINSAMNCPLNCTYCILQHYLTNPLVTVFVNTDDLWNQLDLFLSRQRKRILRIGTGELTDSLALDHITEHSQECISYFKKKTHVLFEIKTKTVNIGNILKAKPAENIIVAWSLNSPIIARDEEKGCPSIEERIAASRILALKGFRVAFHFDPLILYPGWEEGYAWTVHRLFREVPVSQIAWISLGSFRFPPGLKPIIKKRFPATQIIYEEFIRGKDGKYRYFKPHRLKQYKTIMDFIKKGRGGAVPIYLCMESRNIWKEVLNKKPKGKETVETLISLPFGSIR